MEIKHYFALVRRWAWLGILGLILGAAGGYFFSARQTPIYQASTRFVILRPAQAVNDYNAYLDSQQLVSTYIQLLTSDAVLKATSDQLGYPVYAGQATGKQLSDTQFVDLTVTDPNPEHAADIANILVTTLIDQNDKLQSVRYVTSEQNLQDQVNQVQVQINTLQTQINDISSATVSDQLFQVQTQITSLQNQIADLNNQITDLKRKYPTTDIKKQISDKQATLDQITPVLALYQQVYTNLVVLGKPVSDSTSSSNSRLVQLQTTLNLYQQIYLNLLNSLQAMQLSRAQSTPTVVQVNPATVPTSPISPHPLQTAGMAAAVGLMLAAGIAFLVEYLDDTLKTMDDIERVLNLPVVGYIAQIQYGKGGEDSLYVTRQPRSPVSEAFRSLRSNLEFAGVDRPLRKILVTSAGPGEGKTTVAVNLAAIFAQGGKRVVVLDADLRKPRVHRFLGLPNQIGLSDLFRGSAQLPAVFQNSSEQENFSVVTSGPLPPNPAELLASARMDQILAEAEKEADIIVVDGPPTLVADVQIMAAKVDGVLLVIYPGHTHTDAALATLEQLNRAGARILGVVLNKIPRQRAEYYGGYRHYSPYYSSYQYHYYSTEESQKPASVFQRLFRNGNHGGNGHKKSEPLPQEETSGGKQE